MASSFGFTPAPAAPSTPAFGSSPAPAFGSTTTPAPAPLFGSTPAPAGGGLFGSSNPAPAPGGLFGGTPAATAPASTGFAFSSSPAPAPSSGLFGSTPAPAPAGGFGSTSTFGQPAAAPAPAAPLMIITASTPYSALPPEAKRAIDTIHDEIMRHKRTMNNVETMAPALLREPINAADAAAGGNGSNLQQQLQELQHSLQGLQANIVKCSQQADSLQKQMETSTTQSIMYGIWPIEAVANRRGVKLSSDQKSTDPSVRDQLERLLNEQVKHVDRMELIPSPYMWETLQDLERRLSILMQQVSMLNNELDHVSTSDEVIDVAAIVHSQTDAIARVGFMVAKVHEQMEQLRIKYRRTERGENILDKADIAEFERQRQLEQKAKQQYMKAAGQQQQAPTAAPTTAAPATSGLFSTAPTPASGSLFGRTPTPAPATGGLFGSPAPAPATGGLFGNTPAPAAPAPAPTGGLFGNAPAPATAAPAPSGGGLFGSTPAPAPGGTSAPAPVGTGAPPAPSLFGATPAPSTTPAPATGFLFGGASSTPSTSSSASTPRTGNRSRNRSSRR